LANGTAAAYDVGVTTRDISSPTFTSATNGGFVSATCTPTTNNKVHNILSGALLFDASL
jgi:hypothetical protein